MENPASFPRGFASDNFAGIHPQVLDKLIACNRGHAMAYGDDPVTARARQAFNRLFGRQVTTHFVFNGTGANITALMSFARPHGAVLCSEVAHVQNDESTAPERTLGMRLIPVHSPNGKIDPEALEAALHKGHGVHCAMPVALTLTEPTEVGTLYSVDELQALVRVAKRYGLGVHVDGARIGCAAAALGVDLPTLLRGVDVLSFGGTKQGMLVGEAVVFLEPSVGRDYPYWQKCAMQLASKNRFIAAQFEGLLEGDLWLQNGRHANAMATKLHAGVRSFDWVKVVYPVQANSVFVQLPKERIALLQAESFFWPWDEAAGVVRWMCAFDTQPEDITAFVGRLERMQGRA